VAGRLVVALDLGTTTARALVVGEDARVAGRAARPVPVAFPGAGRVEHDPEALWRAALAVLRAAVADAGASPQELAALGVASQRSTAVAFDARTGAALAPAIGWQDQRTAGRVAELRARGLPLNTLASATKFEWWLQRPGPVADAARAGRLRLGTPDVWLTHRLTGGRAFATDPGQAACTALYDGRRADWAPGALELFGLERRFLPEVVASNAVVGDCEPGWLGAALPVAARAGDQQAAGFAQGLAREGDAKLTLGTSAMAQRHTGASARAGVEGSHPLPLWSLASGERAFCLEGTVVTAGAAVDWLVELGLLAAPGRLDAVLAATPDASGAAFVPALQGLGTPVQDLDARGLLGGLTRGTTRSQVVRAVADGVAQRCVDVLEALSVEAAAVPVDGGLARSHGLLQAVADLSGRTLARAAEPETTALGAALLAGLAVELWPDRAAFLERRAPPTRFEPAVSAGTRRRRRARWLEVRARALS